MQWTTPLFLTPLPRHNILCRDGADMRNAAEILKKLRLKKLF